MCIFWSTIQLGLAIICCCLPTYGPLFSAARPIAHRCKDLYKSATSSQNSPSTHSRGSSNAYAWRWNPKGSVSTAGAGDVEAQAGIHEKSDIHQESFASNTKSNGVYPTVACPPRASINHLQIPCIDDEFNFACSCCGPMTEPRRGN